MTAGATILLLENAEGAVLKELSQFCRHLLIPAFAVELQLPNEQSLRQDNCSNWFLTLQRTID
jgi:hypothetical protein